MASAAKLWWDVPVIDSFDLLRDIYGIPQTEYQTRLSELSETLFITNLLRTPVRQLSLGQRMRCEVTAALLHSPKILFLDEPTIGLDAISKLALRDFLKKENRDHGVTMILTTHDMTDIEALCSRVMTIGHGKLLFDGTLESMKQRYAPLHRIRATLQSISSAILTPPSSIAAFHFDGDQLTVLFDTRTISADKIVAQIANAYPLKDIMVETIS